MPGAVRQDVRRGEPGDGPRRSRRAAEGDAADVEAAVADADIGRRRSGRRWRPASGARWWDSARRLLKTHTEELARLIALETGKALRTESRIEAQAVADIFEMYAGLGGELKGESGAVRAQRAECHGA